MMCQTEKLGKQMPQSTKHPAEANIHDFLTGITNREEPSKYR